MTTVPVIKVCKVWSTVALLAPPSELPLIVSIQMYIQQEVGPDTYYCHLLNVVHTVLSYNSDHMHCLWTLSLTIYYKE